MKVFVCIALLVVAAQASVLPGGRVPLRDWSKIQERWSTLESSHETPKTGPAAIRRTPSRSMRVEGCGIPKMTADGKIVNGIEAEPHQFPWAVGLFIDGTSFCTGSLISNEWIITAGHCTTGARFMDVYIGAHNVRIPEDFRLEVRATNIITHEEYGPFLLKNDIGLVKLPAPITFTNDIYPICLTTRDAPDYVGETVTIAGWGKISDSTSVISPTLQTANVTVIPNSVCQVTYGSTITDATMCTSVSPSGTCNGDSGSALNYFDKSTGLWTQVGVTSFVSSAGCESGLPDGFTRLSSFIDWIEQKTGGIA